MDHHYLALFDLIYCREERSVLKNKSKINCCAVQLLSKISLLKQAPIDNSNREKEGRSRKEKRKKEKKKHSKKVKMHSGESSYNIKRRGSGNTGKRQNPQDSEMTSKKTGKEKRKKQERRTEKKKKRPAT